MSERSCSGYGSEELFLDEDGVVSVCSLIVGSYILRRKNKNAHTESRSFMQDQNCVKVQSSDVWPYRTVENNETNLAGIDSFGYSRGSAVPLLSRIGLGVVLNARCARL